MLKSPQKRTAIFLVLIIIGTLSVFSATTISFEANKIRIIDPTIGAAQFVEPSESFEIKVFNPGNLILSKWVIELESSEFEWAPHIELEIEKISGPIQGEYKFIVNCPFSTPLGLYDLIVHYLFLGKLFTIKESNTIYVYNATTLTQLNFAHFTDPHVHWENPVITISNSYWNTTKNETQIATNELFHNRMQEISQIHPLFVMVTGDLSTSGREPEFRKIREIFADAKVPVLASIGNHEYRSPPSYEYYIGPRYYVRSVGNWRIIILDTGASEGNGLFGEQMTWYKAQLIQAESKHQQVIVGMHIPSAPQAIAGYTIAGNDQFRALNQKYHVKGIFAGHHHTDDANFPNGTQVNLPDPLPAKYGPYYIKTKSISLAYGNGPRDYIGWRYITSTSDGNLSIGYDFNNLGFSDPTYGLPIDGLNITSNNTAMVIQNHYLKSFFHIVLSITLPISSSKEQYIVSDGLILSQTMTEEKIGLMFETDILANTTKIINFTKITG